MPTGQIKKERSKAMRYKTEDDEDDGTMALMAAAVGPPAMCAVFVIPDEDEAAPEYIEDADRELKRVIGKLRALNLNVDEFRNKSNTRVFLKISAPDTLLRYEAEAQVYQLRLKEDLGGALCAYTAELEEKDAFDQPLDKGHPLFCSAQQLKIIRSVVYSEAYQAEGEDEGDVIDFEALANRPPPNTDSPIVLAYFGLHHDRVRLKLLAEWAGAATKPQPLELVREYFGEKIALFYTWFGFYCTMLWVPSLFSIFVFGTQILAYAETGSLESPYVAVYACVISLWANAFCSLWKQLENTRQYQWDMLDFENFEDLREEFKESGKTVKASSSDECDPHINEITDEIDEYWYDDGAYFPVPSGRARDQLATYTVVGILIFVVIMGFVFIWANVTSPMMSPGDVLLGGILAGVLNSVLTIAIDIIMDGIAELELQGLTYRLVGEENWETGTKYEDAMIMKTFYFKFFSKYFALIMVAFFVNYVELQGAVHKCPDFQCMPVARCMFIAICTIDVLYQLIVLHVFPVVNKFFDNLNSPAAMQAAAGVKVQLTPQEQQFEWLDSTPTIDLYRDKVYQFGYIVLFSVLFPPVVPIFLALNLVEIRSRAHFLLTMNRRPEPLQAADIGSYQAILELLATLSIVSNSSLLGVTGYGLYFYFPDMSIVESLWASIILEHILFCAKMFLSSILPADVPLAKLEYEVAEDHKKAQLKRWGIVENEIEDPTPWE